MPDILVINPSSHPAAPSTVYILEPQTPAGREWLDEHVEAEFSWGAGIVVEHRYVLPIVEGALEAGLEVK